MTLIKSTFGQHLSRSCFSLLDLASSTFEWGKIDFELQCCSVVKCIHLTEALGLAFTLQVTVALDPVKKIVYHCQQGHCHYCYHNHIIIVGMIIIVIMIKKSRKSIALLSLKSRKLLSSNIWHISQRNIYDWPISDTVTLFLDFKLLSIASVSLW